MFRVKLRCLKTCSKKVQTKPAPSHACGQLPLNSIFQPPLNKTSQDLCEHIAPSRKVDSLARRNTTSWRLVGAKPKRDPTSWRPIYSPKCVLWSITTFQPCMGSTKSLFLEPVGTTGRKRIVLIRTLCGGWAFPRWPRRLQEQPLLPSYKGADSVECFAPKSHTSHKLSTSLATWFK